MWKIVRQLKTRKQGSGKKLRKMLLQTGRKLSKGMGEIVKSQKQTNKQKLKQKIWSWKIDKGCPQFHCPGFWTQARGRDAFPGWWDGKRPDLPASLLCSLLLVLKMYAVSAFTGYTGCRRLLIMLRMPCHIETSSLSAEIQMWSTASESTIMTGKISTHSSFWALSTCWIISGWEKKQIN